MRVSAIGTSATERHDFAPGGLRNLRERAAVRQRVNRFKAVGLSDPLERLDRDVAQHARTPARAAPSSAIVAGNRAQRRRVHRTPPRSRARRTPARPRPRRAIEADDLASGSSSADFFEVGETNSRIGDACGGPAFGSGRSAGMAPPPAWPDGPACDCTWASLEPGCRGGTRDPPYGTRSGLRRSSPSARWTSLPGAPRARSVEKPHPSRGCSPARACQFRGYVHPCRYRTSSAPDNPDAPDHPVRARDIPIGIADEPGNRSQVNAAQAPVGFRRIHPCSRQSNRGTVDRPSRADTRSTSALAIPPCTQAGKRLREPGDHDCAAASQLAQPIAMAIGSGQREIGRWDHLLRAAPGGFRRGPARS